MQMSGDMEMKLRMPKVYQGHGWSKEIKKEQKSNKYFIVSRVIGKLANEKTCAHRKKGLEESLCKVTSISKAINLWNLSQKYMVCHKHEGKPVMGTKSQLDLVG